MIRTRVGFSDGAEVVQVDFDPETVSYNSLLDVFWKSHNPTSANNSRLYHNGIFFHNQKQKMKAKQSLLSRQKSLGKKITSTVEFANFSLARQADQKYYLRNNRRLWRELLAHYPKKEDAAESPAAAKINGYLAGNSNKAQFQAYAKGLGLSKSSLEYLEQRVPTKARHFTPRCDLPRL